MGGTYIICPKTRMVDFIDVKKGPKHRGEMGRIFKKHVDFLLIDPVTFEPKIAIELNGKSHDTQKMRDRDLLVRNVYEAVGIEFREVIVGSDYKKIIPQTF